ncbi:DUF1524 domain-containing protein [Arthrobacter sp. I2-34]|uniref:DUF1524 domain-containing protein n=1 Tax=Arthrobacter hankyongi TaxID=2904801 RepID=A0ABS9L348_9MICC|nr:DUF1524 domain-containing protein [Arthrobacter hankyongi]MCG2621071.1 DUF1524 domain-containing protein [Arthrobacter hankyongi]
MNVKPQTKILSLLAAVLIAAGAAGCGQPGAAGAAPAENTAAATNLTQPARAGTALALLKTVAVKGRAPKTGYTREQFGNGWQDPDGNGCDARNDVLNRDLLKTGHKPGTHGCIVTTGTLKDPYTAATISFVRGNATSTAVQIDHVVALSDAWQKGAQQLPAAKREALANDPLNLIAADGPTNGAKSDSDAASWLPPNKKFRCRYVARQTAVKAKYGLWMTKAERTAIAEVLSSCPAEPVPSAADAAKRTTAGSSSTPGTAAAEPAPSTVVYQNCAAVKAAGAAPIRAGDPGWDSKFDRDGDGVGCDA